MRISSPADGRAAHTIAPSTASGETPAPTVVRPSTCSREGRGHAGEEAAAVAGAEVVGVVLLAADPQPAVSTAAIIAAVTARADLMRGSPSPVSA